MLRPMNVNVYSVLIIDNNNKKNNMKIEMKM